MPLQRWRGREKSNRAQLLTEKPKHFSKGALHYFKQISVVMGGGGALPNLKQNIIQMKIKTLWHESRREGEEVSRQPGKPCTLFVNLPVYRSGKNSREKPIRMLEMAVPLRTMIFRISEYEAEKWGLGPKWRWLFKVILRPAAEKLWQTLDGWVPQIPVTGFQVNNTEEASIGGLTMIEWLRTPPFHSFCGV